MERFTAIPFAHQHRPEDWKVLDWKTGRYLPRAWDTMQQAKRYASRRNREHETATGPRYQIGPGGEWVAA